MAKRKGRQIPRMTRQGKYRIPKVGVRVVYYSHITDRYLWFTKDGKSRVVNKKKITKVK